VPELETLLASLQATLGGSAQQPSSSFEFTAEANPESVTPEKARLLLAAGVNRVSMGAQSFDAGRLRFLDRPHDARKIVDSYHVLRDAGFENLSLDLIFGLPGQTLAQWDDDLRQALELCPEHLSCYNLTYEPGTRLHSDLQRGRVHQNHDADDRVLFEHTRKRLADAGYEAYEVSNFARADRACQHNLGYWNANDYLGVGPGAASHRSGVRSTNSRSLSVYIDLLNRGLPATESAETLSPRQRLCEAAWLGLRRSVGIDLTVLSGRFALDARACLTNPLELYSRLGMLEQTGERVALTAGGLLFLDTVAAAFLEAA
jgi:oxygen-independent coproporphyrinogen-3 oxidase